MMIVVLLILLCGVAPARAEGVRVLLLEAARAEAMRQAPVQAAGSAQPMSPALKWTGIGLLIGGGVTLATGVLVDDACIDDGEHSASFCNDLQTAWVASGGVLAGAGAALLLIGNARRSSSPSVLVGPKRVVWRLRF
jgi:hypothetical protein